MLYLAWFISDLFIKGTAGSSITSIISGLSYFHKIRNISDASQAFTIRQLLISVRKQQPSIDHRHPISEGLLRKLCDSMPSLATSSFEACLFRTMFLTAFNFALRVGEITDSVHNIPLEQIVITPAEVTVCFKSFKHAPHHPGTHTVLASSSPYCLVRALNLYLSLRGSCPGPLFRLHGKPVSRNLFATTLRCLLQQVGEHHSNFNTHSFRIGAATSWANKGLSDIQIKRMGRWRSDAVIRYIRGNIIHTQM